MFLTSTNWGRNSSHILFRWVLSYALTPQIASAVCPHSSPERKLQQDRITLPQALEIYYPSINPILDPSLKEKYSQDITGLICALLRRTIPNQPDTSERSTSMRDINTPLVFRKLHNTLQLEWRAVKSCMRRLAIRIQHLKRHGCDQSGTCGSVQCFRKNGKQP